MPISNVWLQIYGQIKHTQSIETINIFLFFQKLCQYVIKLQTKIQITERHNKSKLKNTCRIKK